MDYHAVHGHDRASFDTSDTHRLPTVSASQILDDLQDSNSTLISTGLDNLDQALLGPASINSQGSSHRGGIKRGQVTEIWGPPGAGKTALGVKAFVNTATKAHSSDAENEAPDKSLSLFFHYSCLTLPHFIALVSRPTPKSIAANCSLLVISSLSALINSAVPKSHENKTAPTTSKGPTPVAKRIQALQSIINALQKLAATRNCAVVILSQCATRMHSERGATLTSAINATVWEQGISTQLVLFRDWIWQGNRLASVFLAGLQKVDGRSSHGAFENTIAFRVEPDGVVTVPYDPTQSIEMTVRHKRKLGNTELEVPDSEDEDYGWADEDDAAMPPQPSQWQGSEDILLGHDVGQSDDEEEYSEDGRAEYDEIDRCD
ncbi:hypothetical protein BGZ63DRAFT_353263 [Mariannaea sp. PMI_226]|nr:hypothetical protein BGZ63DRAFT_353263 [Mariannaea sp. PMI_226]